MTAPHAAWPETDPLVKDAARGVIKESYLTPDVLDLPDEEIRRAAGLREKATAKPGRKARQRIDRRHRKAPAA